MEQPAETSPTMSQDLRSMTMPEPERSTAASPPAFILNLNAGRFRRDPALEHRVVDAVGGRGRVLATRTDAELNAAAARAIAERATPVVLCGGDGTYLAGITALVRA